MKLETEELDGGVLKVRLSGRMDIAGVDTIAMPFAALASTDNRRVILDLAGVDFLASIGIRAILQNARAHKLRGGGHGHPRAAAARRRGPAGGRRLERRADRARPRGGPRGARRLRRG